MKKISALSALVLAGAFVTSLAANAATMLAAKNGMTVYVFDKDEGGTPTCDRCLQQAMARISCQERWKDGRGVGHREAEQTAAAIDL